MTGPRIDRMPSSRRDELVRVAAGEFAIAGYGGASLNHIIRACRMSKSSFYYVFPSKMDLYDFVIRELLNGVADAVAAPAPEEFAHAQFWPRAERFFGHLVDLSQREESLLPLGRMFYSAAPEGAKGAVAATLASVRTWLDNVLQIGRGSGAVREDLPAELQSSVVFGVLQVFDEWSVAHFGDFDPADMRRFAVAQFTTIKRILQP